MDASTILQTKLNVPPLRPNRVPRLHLIDRLEAGMAGRLTLISAPAGYGKTTLVTDWLLKTGNRIAWLSLDEADNDPRRFLDYLLAALRRVQPEIGRTVEGMLQSPQPPPNEVILTALLNEIAAVPELFILVLDDYQLIHSLPIHAQLNFLLDHQPPQLHLVLITREDPPLPLSRLRARGQLNEIRQTDLRFSPQECTDFLQRVMGLRLASEDVLALERRTEGWIAGLQLAALSMRGQEDVSSLIQAFTGSSRYILEYLMDEVFERQPLELKDFLLKTSSFERFSASLCEAVTGKADSQETLDALEGANLFIVPLDQSRQWYRYHRLFAELLCQRLYATKTISVEALHRLACQWFAKEGLIPEAIQHALAGADWERAAELVSSQSVMMLRRGELMTLLGWLKHLPDEAICARPQLCRDYGWALTLTGQLDAADKYLEHAEAIVRGDDALLGEILVAQAYNRRVRGDIAQAIERARRALSLLPQEDALSRSLVALTLGLAYWTYGNFQESERAFLEVDRTAQQSRNHYARLTALTYLGMIQAVYGRLRRAAELCRQVIQLGGQSPPVAPAHIELGALLYEWNDLETAVEHLQIGIGLSQRSGNPLIQSDGYRTLATVHQGRGEPGAALSALGQADRLADTHQISPLSAMRNASCHAQLALAQDDLAAAQFWAEQVAEPTDHCLFYTCLGLTPVRILLARQEKSQAADGLAQLCDIASQKGCGAGMIEVRTLQALAADKPQDALHFLQDALQMAQPEGFIRTFVDKGQPMKALLERLKAQGGALKPYILTLLSAFGETSRVPKSGPLIEPLSQREVEILGLLAEGLSNREIADRLYVGIGTIKSHVHHILEKLGSDSRMGAAAKARELGLL